MIINKRSILIVIFLFVFIFLFYTKGKNDKKVYMRIIKSDDKRIKYNYRNLPINEVQLERIYFLLGIKRYNFYYYKDGKYVGRNNDDYDTILQSFRNVFYWSNRDDSDEIDMGGRVYRFDGAKLIYNADEYAGFFINPNKFVASSLDSRNIFYNKEGYLKYIHTNAEDDVDNFDGLYETGYEYEYVYYNGELTYDGKKKISKIFKKKNRDNLVAVYCVKYDKNHRISEISCQNKIDEKYRYIIYFVYKNNILYKIIKENLGKNSFSYFSYFRKYGEYGYENYFCIYPVFPFKNKKELISWLDVVKIDGSFKMYGWERSYKYERANPKYKDNLKLQVIFMDKGDIIDHYLGISSWYRYKYMHDLTTDD